MVGSLERKSRHQLMAALRSLHFLNISELFQADVFLFVPGLHILNGLIHT
jgi:hypothetical protein